MLFLLLSEVWLLAPGSLVLPWPAQPFLSYEGLFSIKGTRDQVQDSGCLLVPGTSWIEMGPVTVLNDPAIWFCYGVLCPGNKASVPGGS